MCTKFRLQPIFGKYKKRGTELDHPDRTNMLCNSACMFPKKNIKKLAETGQKSFNNIKKIYSIFCVNVELFHGVQSIYLSKLVFADQI